MNITIASTIISASIHPRRNSLKGMDCRITTITPGISRSFIPLCPHLQGRGHLHNMFDIPSCNSVRTPVFSTQSGVHALQIPLRTRILIYTQLCRVGRLFGSLYPMVTTLTCKYVSLFLHRHALPRGKHCTDAPVYPYLTPYPTIMGQRSPLKRVPTSYGSYPSLQICEQPIQPHLFTF